MRVELVYTQECSTVRQLLDMLETAVAEEGLPLPIELVTTNSIRENSTSHAGLRIDGDLVSEFPNEPVKSGIIDRMREALCWKWHQFSVPERFLGKFFRAA